MEPLGLLARASLRKIAHDSGFDLPTDAPSWVEAASTQAPLRAWLAMSDQGSVLIGLSMANVAQALTDLGNGGEATLRPAQPGLPAASAWFACTTLLVADGVLARAWELSRTLPQALVSRFREQVARELANGATPVTATAREAWVKQRIGQQLFRDGLLTLWQARCAISGLNVPELLRASHAKPWADSTDDERLDVYNGLLLAASLDAAFDVGLIALTTDGRVMVSRHLPKTAVATLGLDMQTRVLVSAAHERYLEWHRRMVFRA